MVDPGFDPDSILAILQREGLGLAAILNTHGHTDHIAGNAALKAAFPEAPLIIGRRRSAAVGRRPRQSQRDVRDSHHEPARRPPRRRG